MPAGAPAPDEGWKQGAVLNCPSSRGIRLSLNQITRLDFRQLRLDPLLIDLIHNRVPVITLQRVAYM